MFYFPQEEASEDQARGCVPVPEASPRKETVANRLKDGSVDAELGRQSLACLRCGSTLRYSANLGIWICTACRRRSLAQFDDPDQLQLGDVTEGEPA